MDLEKHVYKIIYLVIKTPKSLMFYMYTPLRYIHTYILMVYVYTYIYIGIDIYTYIQYL